MSLSIDCRELMDRFARQRILVAGDIMLDWFIWGGVSRISPEAPVPVVEVQEEDRYPGGAANVARNLTPFLGQVKLAGLYGNDPNGALLRQSLQASGIDASLCREFGGFQTITKTRVVAQHQQVVRIDREDKRRLLDSKSEAELLGQILEELPQLDGLVIADYGKGFVTEDFANRIIAEARKNGRVVTVDPKPDNPILWQGATTVKPNRSEAFSCSGIEDVHRDDLLNPLRDEPLLKAGAALREKWNCEHVLLTLGEQGMLLFSEEDPLLIPAQAKEVFDVSGAGDTAIAVYTMCLCAGLDAGEAARISNLASSTVVGKLGTTPIEKDELCEAIENA